MHHHATIMRLKSGHLRECVQAIRGLSVQRLNRLAADVGQICCGNPSSVLNDVALSDAHRLRDQTTTYVILEQACMQGAGFCRTHLMPVDYASVLLPKLFLLIVIINVVLS